MTQFDHHDAGMKHKAPRSFMTGSIRGIHALTRAHMSSQAAAGSAIGSAGTEKP